MYLLQVLSVAYLFTTNFPSICAVQPAEKKSWQDVNTGGVQDAKLDGSGFATGVEYSGRDMAGYSTGTDYSNGIGNYGNNYDGNMNGNSYGGDSRGGGGGFNGVSYSESYSSPTESFSGHGEAFSSSNDGFTSPGNGFSSPNDGFSGHGNGFSASSDSFSNHGDGFGSGLQNSGWDKNVKTVVKHTIKNIAVPHAVPAPVSVPVPRYVKYFKPFAIAKPVGVPHIIPVIKHIQKPIPFFTALPIHQSVPVPKFVGLPVQVRVPKPVFIHVPKIFPVAKRFPVPVEVNIPKPYIVPIYKHVPVPVPHRVPKVINIIKEVPHYVKKPVPVFVDDHSSDYGGGGGAYTSSSYSNDYGNDHQGGYGNEDHSYGGPHGSGTAHHTSSFNNMDLGYSNNGGLDFNQYQSYNSPQQNNQYGSHYFFNNNKEQGQKSYPAITYPRAHRLPNKSQVTKLKDSTGYQSADGSNSPNNNHASAFELSVEVKQNGMKGNNLNYNKDASAINSQVPVSATNDNYYQSIRGHNKPYNNIGSSPTSINSHSASSNSAESFSQPLFNPSAYAEYTLNQQKNPNDTYMQYSQPVYSNTPAAQTSTASTGIVAEASKSFSNYQPFPSNSYNNGYGMSQQSNNFNSIPHQDKLSSYNDAKSAYPKSNFDFNSLFKQPITYQPPQESSWETNANFHNSNFNMNKYHQPSQQNQASSYSQQSSKNNYGYNKDTVDFGGNSMNNNYNGQNGYQSSYPQNNNQNNYNAFDSYIPSGSSHSSSSYSNSFSQPSQGYQNDQSNINSYRQNEKYDQSPSQNSYSSTANLAAPGLFSPSGTSYSSSSTYNNEYGNSPSFSPQETRQVSASVSMNNIPGNSQALTNDFIKHPNGYSNYQSYFPKPQENLQENGGISNLAFNMNNPTSQSNTHASYLESSLYSPQESKQSFNTNSDVSAMKNYANNEQQAQKDSLSHFVNSASSTYSQPASSTSAYTSNSFSNSKSYSAQPQSSNNPSEIFGNSNAQLYNNNASREAAFSTNQPIITAPDIATSYNYAYSQQFQQASEPSPVYTGLPLYSNSYSTNDGKYSQLSQPQMNQHQSQNPLNSPASSQQTGSNQESSVFKPKTDPQSLSSAISKPFQGFDSKLDEMEQHMEPSGSSIINVYTNSPDSKEAKKGHTFTFLDPASLESSHSKYYIPPDSTSNKKSKYSNTDMQIVKAPSFNSDPNEPLQTSLDAYVPQPVYYPPTNDQNTVYKEAMTVTDTVYKEAVSLDSSSKEKSR